MIVCGYVMEYKLDVYIGDVYGLYVDLNICDVLGGVDDMREGIVMGGEVLLIRK